MLLHSYLPFLELLFPMVKFLLLAVLSLSSLSFSTSVFSLSESQRNEMRKAVQNMQALLPRRIDQMSTVSKTWFEKDIWYMNIRVQTGGHILQKNQKNFIRDYLKDQYCRPPYEYIDAGLTITTQYFDEKGNFLFNAIANRRICGR